MSVSLKAFRFTDREDASTPWTSGSLRFGRFLTFLDAANGAGKTPLMRGIAAALGHSLELPPQVIENCYSAVLELDVGGEAVVLERLLTSDFEIRVSSGHAPLVVITSESEFSDLLLPLLGISLRALTTKEGHESAVYAPVLLPLFYVDQDTGWGAEYSAPTNKRFIDSQPEELVRLALGLPARHPFRGKELESAKRRIREIITEAESLRAVLKRQKSSSELALTRDIQSLQDELADARGQLERLHSGLSGLQTGTGTIDSEIQSLDKLLSEQRNLGRRLLGERKRLNAVAAELGAEIDILATNETAKSAFVQFCGNENCQLFRNSEQTFGKQLLYLKDQIKDLSSTDGVLSAEMERLEGELAETGARRTRLVSAKRKSLEDGGHSAIVTSIEEASRRLANAELVLSRRKSYDLSVKRLEALADENGALTAQIAELNKANPLARTGDIRALLEKRIEHWLKLLGTRNIETVVLDSTFRLVLDDIPFSGSSHHSGSTRTRIVLAFHAALLDVGISVGGDHPRLLLLDAPRQHELHEADIKRYLDGLRQLSARSGGGLQVVVAATELTLEVEAGDVVWSPNFLVDGETAPHFLGSPKAVAGQ